ncbi:MAG: hypothetical protein K1X75_03570 [Leptospirales bacterium]|nr:hypothetical protein [Leptospirales bacterium]
MSNQQALSCESGNSSDELAFEQELAARVGSRAFRADFSEVAFAAAPGRIMITAAPRDLRRLQIRHQKLIDECAARLNLQAQLCLAASGASRHSPQIRRPPAVPDQTKGPAAQAFFPPTTSATTLRRLKENPPPLAIILGPVGAGKSAAIDWILHQQQSSGKSVRRYTLEAFVSEFAEACSRRATVAWRRSLHQLQCIAIDDFQYIKAQAARSQEELSNLADHCLREGRTLLLSSDRRPAELSLSEALQSRLQSAELAELAPLGEEARCKLLENELLRHEIQLEASLVLWLARRVQIDLRRLKAIALRLAHSGSQRLDLEACQTLCQDLFDQGSGARAEDVVRTTASHLKIELSALLGQARSRRLSQARHMAAFLCVKHLGLSQRDTARALGWAEHGSVIHALRKIETQLQSDLFLQRQLTELWQRVCQNSSLLPAPPDA